MDSQEFRSIIHYESWSQDFDLPTCDPWLDLSSLSRWGRTKVTEHREVHSLSKKKRFLIIYLLHHIDRFNFWWTHLEHCVGFLEQLDLVLRRFVDWFIDSWLIHVFSISTWLFFKFIINKKKPCWLNSRYISSCIIWHIKVRLWVTYKWHFSYVSNFYYFYFYTYFKIISIKSFLTDVVMLDQSTFSSSPLPVFFSVSTNWFRFKFTTFFWCSTPPPPPCPLA